MVAKGWLFAEAMVGNLWNWVVLPASKGQRKRKPNHGARRGNPPCSIETTIFTSIPRLKGESLAGRFSLKSSCHRK
ncbi:MAG: hypothetical protein CMM00_06470 [Rhodopirellula sp.]|uniref:Uncharacterized protein n=1 Tax=Rhodopirellula europaea SH398 TaxID=1263868 RepID=M5RWL0_9BACT|nr:hypothetical protein RESH_05799 [Rhodopirellula europaea SH398]MAP08469.1 hypothetical protein [Rhodopirellula sp.]